MSTRRNKTTLSAALCSALTVAGCKSPATGAASGAPSVVSVAAAAPLLPDALPKPWFSGGFSGQYTATLAPVGVKTGAAREWASDDGKLASGPGKLSLEVSDDGSVQGVSEAQLARRQRP